jgi:DeoR family transcriptional regulator of aga operon
MNRADRLNAILELLGESGRVEVETIMRELEVSAPTARRDLDALAGQQLLTRTRGGALSHSVAYDLPLRYKRARHGDAKARIAAAASDLVRPGDVVGLSGGTTSTAIAAALAARPDLMASGAQPSLTVVTNALNIAVQLVVRPQIKTVVTGGVANPRSYELVGPYSTSVLDQITLDLAFIGVNGVSPDVGGTVHDEREATINALMAQRAAKAVIVADSSKIGRRAFATLGVPDAVRTLITDDGIADEQRAAFEERGFEVIVAR